MCVNRLCIQHINSSLWNVCHIQSEIKIKLCYAQSSDLKGKKGNVQQPES